MHGTSHDKESPSSNTMTSWKHILLYTRTRETSYFLLSLIRTTPKRRQSESRMRVGCRGVKAGCRRSRRECCCCCCCYWVSGSAAVDTGTINYFLYFLSFSSHRGTGEERKRKETCPEREREREGIDTQTESSASEGERGTERESCLTGNKKEAGWGIYPKTPTGRRGSGVTRRLAQQGRGGRRLDKSLVLGLKLLSPAPVASHGKRSPEKVFFFKAISSIPRDETRHVVKRTSRHGVCSSTYRDVQVVERVSRRRVVVRGEKRGCVRGVT